MRKISDFALEGLMYVIWALITIGFLLFEKKEIKKSKDTDEESEGEEGRCCG